MNKHNKPKIHTTEFLDDFFSEISKMELKETSSRMKLASVIEDAMKAKDISKSQLAKLMNQNNSVITKWLSGTHNFTSDTLEQIGETLDVDLLINYNPVTVVIPKKVIKKSHIPVKRNFLAEKIPGFISVTSYSPAYF